MTLKHPTKKWTIAVAAVLLMILEVQLVLSTRQNSQTFDESAHLYAGYSYLKQGDFGINPEHPPLVKMVAALPLLPLGLPVPAPPPIHFRSASMVGGLQFLYSHDADSLLFRARAATSLFTLALALAVFLAAYEMFGAGAGLIALLILVFEPNILANGALVTTDVGAACFIFATVYAFYRYCKKPSALRLALCCLTTGLALAAKHSAVLLLPIFVVLAISEIVRRRGADGPNQTTRGRQALNLLGVMATITVISVTILWSFYGFRYAARPVIAPSTAEYLKSLKHPVEANVIGFMERHRLLPEAYLYGMTDIVRLSNHGRSAFLLGHTYPSGRWFYFPTAFVIKSTIGFMLLLVLIVAVKKNWRIEHRRELIYLTAPPLIWIAFAMTSKLDIGLRHILPVYPFLIVLAGAVAWTLARQSRNWAFVVGALMMFHIGSSLRAFPNYLPYSNEAFGGPSNTYKAVADANVGWEGGLKTFQAYLSNHHITHCWFAFDGPNNPAYYHIPCSPLPTFFSLISGHPQDIVPEKIQGPVFLGSAVLTGSDWGPDDLNPYQQFVGTRPSAVIGGEILEYDGSFQVSQVSGISHFAAAYRLFNQKKADAALLEVQSATRLYPEFIWPHSMLASLYAQAKRPDDAMSEYRIAMHIYQTVHPDFQAGYDPPKNPLTGK